MDHMDHVAQDQNPAEIGHLAVKGCRQGLVAMPVARCGLWLVAQHFTCGAERFCFVCSFWEFTCFILLYLVLSCFIGFCFIVAVCLLSILSCISSFLPMFPLLLFCFTLHSHAHYAHMACLVSWCKTRKQVLKHLLKQVLKRGGVLECCKCPGPDLASVPEECPEILVKLMQTCWVGSEFSVLFKL